MITESDAAVPGQSPVTLAERRSRKPFPAARYRPFSLRTIVATGLTAALAGWNLWWYWRDTRALVDLPTIESWIGLGRHAEADRALQEHLRRAPHDAEAMMIRARALAGRGDLKGCAEQLHQVPFWSPRKAEALYREGQAYLMIDRARDAEAALLAVVDSDPLHPPDPAMAHDASQELLKLYAMEDRWDDAYLVFWKAYDHSAPADRPVILSMRVRCELERVTPTEAIKVLARYVAADPEDWEALRSLANAELALGHRAAALRDMQASLNGRPDDPRTWRDYLTMLQSLGDPDAFRAALEQVPQSALGEPEIWTFRGQDRERAGDPAGAAGHYRQALDLNPNQLTARYRLAMIEERLGHPDQAALHRKRWQELRDARVALPQAFSNYYAARTASPSGGPELRASIRRLASVCEALGWLRLAEGWNRLAAST
jgi:tetratricopeptide (TPR) repeat protein